MDSVKVNKNELLTIVKKNQENHRTLFLDAQKVYREDVINELDRMLEGARNGKKIIRSVSLPEPVDHTSDYERVVRMLEMSVDETIELQYRDFEQYVLDQWVWSKQAFDINNSYANKFLG